MKSHSKNISTVTRHLLDFFVIAGHATKVKINILIRSMGPISEEDMVCIFLSPIFRHFLTHYAIKQIAVRLPSQKYSGPNIAHNLNLTPTENQGLNLDLDSQKHGCGSSRSV